MLKEIMGGTRCLFRKCGNNSYNSPGMHFFQFPVKDRERFRLWVKYADVSFINDLTPTQQRNKRLCENHFRDECFMNYKKERLTPHAIPTLDRLDDNLVLDYEESDNPVATQLPEQTAQHLIPPPRYVKSKQLNKKQTCTYEIALDDFNNYELISTDGKDSDPIDLPPQAKIIKQYVPAKCQPAKTPLNRGIKSYSASESILKRKSMRKAENEAISILSDQITYDSGLSFENENEYNQDNLNSHENTMVDLSEENEIQIDNNDDYDLVNSDECLMVEDESSKSDQFETSFQCYIDEINRYKKLLDEETAKSSAALSEVNRLLNNPSQVQTISTSNKPGTSQGLLTKAQLFNGIKKYLSPSMASLVRMEMFAAPEREWKPDEKEISIDLLRLGDNVFNYFRDEWRMRLPPKKDVKKWLLDFDKFDGDDDL